MATSSLSKIFRANLSRTPALALQLSMPLLHDPNLKKKKKQQIDPQKIARMKEREEKRRRAEVIVPPADPDISPDPEWFSEERKRPLAALSAEEKEARVLLLKEYSRHTMRLHKEELCWVQERARCRREALRELKKVSETLYEEAIKVNRTLFPLTISGPSETPAFAGYIAPEIDSSKAK